MNEVMIGIIGLAVVLVMFLTGIELGFAMALVGFLGFSYIVSFKAGLNLIAKDIFDVFSSYGFTVISWSINRSPRGIASSYTVNRRWVVLSYQPTERRYPPGGVPPGIVKKKSWMNTSPGWSVS